MELQLFLERVCRHPTLQRAKVVQQFLESSEWHIDMHSYSGQPMGVSAGPQVQALPPATQHGLMESMGDLFINAFARVRRPDPKFVAVRTKLEEQEDRQLQLERVLLRHRTHVSGTREVVAYDELYSTHLGASTEDLSTDYHDMAHAFEQLAVLESGMAGALQRVGAAMKSMAELETRFTSQVTDDLLTLTHAKQAFLQSHKALLKQRDAKQLDFEGLTDYLHTAVTERERLTSLSDAGGLSEPGAVRGTGLRGYMRSTLDRMWGVDEEQARIERLQRLDGRIDELQGAVQTAHTHAQAFNDHVELEHRVFELGRRHEAHQMLRLYVEGQMALQEQGLVLWDELLQALETPSTQALNEGIEPASSTSASV
ncbi:intercellular trafficking and secretion [Malassezia equina]|uniref:Sorting nexin-4 n=1 Tax=Malassezia equina TaxID=1381935 RepID=A0AAF0EE60_9BASI|nr:intercellular trafficking and secretion [Malassezia equina]